MVCLGKNNYFRFNHPKEAARIKESHTSGRFSIVPDGFYPGRSYFLDILNFIVITSRIKVTQSATSRAHSLNSEQVFHSVQLKTCSEFSKLALLMNHSTERGTYFTSQLFTVSFCGYSFAMSCNLSSQNSPSSFLSLQKNTRFVNGRLSAAARTEVVIAKDVEIISKTGKIAVHVIMIS